MSQPHSRATLRVALVKARQLIATKGSQAPVPMGAALPNFPSPVVPGQEAWGVLSVRPWGPLKLWPPGEPSWFLQGNPKPFSWGECRRVGSPAEGHCAILSPGLPAARRDLSCWHKGGPANSLGLAVLFLAWLPHTRSC